MLGVSAFYCFANFILHLHITIHHPREIRAGTQEGTWRQELKQRPWRSAAYWLAPPGLPSLLSCFINLGVAPHIVIWALPHQTSVKKICSTGSPTGQSGGYVFSIEVSSLKTTVESS